MMVLGGGVVVGPVRIEPLVERLHEDLGRHVLEEVEQTRRRDGGRQVAALEHVELGMIRPLVSQASHERLPG
jgi:hypothetical protein